MLGVIDGSMPIRESGAGHAAGHAAGLDVPGMPLSVLGLLFLVLPPIQRRELGRPVWTYVMMAAPVPALALFVAYERLERSTARWRAACSATARWVSPSMPRSAMTFSVAVAVAISALRVIRPPLVAVHARGQVRAWHTDGGGFPPYVQG
ncbi:hypothetical protein [Streptomyces sp. NPDC053427]|uniref:hypothetical protein n=1 Tax=Streptomyces sp. NPDC053427 TaxID=3365701 RepID=UPI0037D686E4